MRSTKPDIYEYELDGLAKYIYHVNGSQGDAYYSLIANGTNAYMPHYHEKQTQLKDGDLLLMDYSPDYHYYMSDITRVWPVNGKFSEEQAQLYGFYIKCYRAILNNIRPHVPPVQVRKEAAEEMKKILASAKFINPIIVKQQRILSMDLPVHPTDNMPAWVMEWEWLPMMWGIIPKCYYLEWYLPLNRPCGYRKRIFIFVWKISS